MENSANEAYYELIFYSNGEILSSPVRNKYLKHSYLSESALALPI